MSQFLSVSNERSDGTKLIRFFKVVGILGGIVWFSRFLIAAAIIGGILFLLN